MSARASSRGAARLAGASPLCAAAGPQVKQDVDVPLEGTKRELGSPDNGGTGPEAHPPPSLPSRARVLETALQQLEQQLRAQGWGLMSSRGMRVHVGRNAPATPPLNYCAVTLCGRRAPKQTITIHRAWLCRGCARVFAVALLGALLWTPRADSTARHESYHVWLDRVLEAYR